ncbi:hypothetical protein BH10ACT11_BH10ACT11_02850 [soil metagenome]
MLLALGCLSLGLLATAGVAKPHGKHFKPKAGRYIGVGAAKIGAHTYEMRIVFLFKDDTISDLSVLNSIPGPCSTGSGSVAGPVVAKKFKLVNSGSFPSSRVIRGRFTGATAIKGSMSVTYPGPSNCQTGTFKYEWIGKRTGKPT